MYQKTTHFENCGKSVEKYRVIFMLNYSPQAQKLLPILQKHQRLNWTADHVNVTCGLNMKTRWRYGQTPSPHHTSFSGAPCGAFQQPVYHKCKVPWLWVSARPLQAVHNGFLSETLSYALSWQSTTPALAYSYRQVCGFF